jgi:uncharacterized membrane protein YraQ (UPF0718 family)
MAFQLVPFDPARGGEGVSAQGLLLIIMLVLIGFTSWLGIESIFDGFNRWTWISLILLSVTLLVAAIGMRPHAGGVDIFINGKCVGVFISLVVLCWIIKTKFTEDQIRDLLWESWKFVKQIFPLLVVGVFLVGCRTYTEGEYHEPHFHKETTEINLVVKGKLLVNNVLVETNQIFIVAPNEITDIEFLTETTIVCVKTASRQGDKFIVDKNIDPNIQ